MCGGTKTCNICNGQCIYNRVAYMLDASWMKHKNGYSVVIHNQFQSYTNTGRHITTINNRQVHLDIKPNEHLCVLAETDNKIVANKIVANKLFVE
jgi:hypothetical protein